MTSRSTGRSHEDSLLFPTLLLRAYGLLAPLAAPVAQAKFKRDLAREGVPSGRLVERMGRATVAAPPGGRVWFHAASIGESLSILPLVEALADETQILVTSGTATSGKLLAQRLPEGVIHQFAPLDTPTAAQRFLTYWRPHVGVFVESEIWPNLMTRAMRHAGTSLMLVNARMSPRSLARWAKVPGTARKVFSSFLKIYTQNRETHDGLAPFHRSPETALLVGGNLKAAARPLPVDASALQRWRETLGTRPCWVASSTHEGEEEIVLEAHARVRQTYPDALLVLVPRHAHRGGWGITDLAQKLGHETARLGAEETVTTTTSVLVADTMGELGLWYRLSPIVFLAGSLGDAGGHNPWEPIALHAALLHGPNVQNAANDYRDLTDLGAATEVADAPAIADAITRLMSDPAHLAQCQKAAQGALTGADGLVDQILGDIRTFVEYHERSGR
jgi:3-deoxy-D-manno-octulosonic-acid transferase